MPRAVTKSTKTAAQKTPALEPMYASIGHDVPAGRTWTFEPKYDGVRVLAHATRTGVRLVTRNGNDKARQFPELVITLTAMAQALGHPFILDGEIVALVRNTPARFQRLQGRMHLRAEHEIRTLVNEEPVALMAFDLLRDGTTSLLSEPWRVRRTHLQHLLRDAFAALGTSARMVRRHIRLAPSTRGSGAAMVRRAREQGWEGVIAKQIDAPYVPGDRSHAWRKLKVEFRQEFVVGGFTAPRKSRQHIGALLLGYYDKQGRLIYAGHMGGGFTRAGLVEMHRTLEPLIQMRCPFFEEPHPNEPVTWVHPKVVVEVKFSEWTGDGRLRQPIFLGTRDDKSPRDVGREGASVQLAHATSQGESRGKSSPRKGRSKF